MKIDENGQVTLETRDDFGTMYRTMAAVEEYQTTVGWVPQPSIDKVVGGEADVYTPLFWFCVQEHDADPHLFRALVEIGFLSDLARRSKGFVGE